MLSTIQTRYGLQQDRPLLALAPMAGVSDLPFRQLCEDLGADFSVAEMAATAPQLLASSKNQDRLHFAAGSRVKICQIIGNDAEQMAAAAVLYARQGADIIDINLGCPAKKISRKGAGSALLSDLPTVQRIVAAVTQACPVAVTLKTRLGPDHRQYTLQAVAQIALEAGIELISVHGRTRACRFNGQAQFDEIARVKQAFPQLAIIANGDIDSLDKAKYIWRQTNCDGLMIGRAALGKPWLFSQLRQHFDSTYKAPKIDKAALIVEHIKAVQKFYGEGRGVRFARKHIQAYLTTLGQGQKFLLIAQTKHPDEQLQQLAQVLDNTIII